MAVDYNIDFAAHEQLEALFKSLIGKAETLTNEYLDRTASKVMMDEIVGLIRIGKRGGPHAKQSNPLRHKMINLGFIVSTKPKFGYLIFPDEGKGPRNPLEQMFMSKGAMKADKTIIEGLTRVLEQASELK